MRCPRCRRSFEDGLTSCPEDGALLCAPLARRLGRGDLSLQEAGEIALATAEELLLAHRTGRHGRLWPEAIYYRLSGVEQELFLLPAAQAPPPPPEYGTPEGARGEPEDERADLYALGVLIHHLLAGRPPFEGSAAVVGRKHASASPPSLLSLPLHEVPPELDTLVAELLAKAPSLRPKSAAELVARLRDIDLGSTLSGPPPPGLMDRATVESVPSPIPPSLGDSLSEQTAETVAPVREISGGISLNPTLMDLGAQPTRETALEHIDPFGATVLRARPSSALPAEDDGTADTRVRVEPAPRLPSPAKLRVSARPEPAPPAPPPDPADMEEPLGPTTVLGLPATWVLAGLLLIAAVLGAIILWLL